MKRCYECDAEVHWLAPDGRCAKCTRYTPDQVIGEGTDQVEDDDADAFDEDLYQEDTDDEQSNN